MIPDNSAAQGSGMPDVKIPDTGFLRLLGLVRILMAYCLLHTITFGHVLFAPLWYPHSFWTPVSLAFLFNGAPNVAQIEWIAVVAMASTVALGLGLFTRLSGAIAFLFGCMLICISFSYGRLSHNTNTVFLMLFVFSFSDWGHFYSLDSLIRRWLKRPAHILKTYTMEWPITLTLAGFSMPYFTTSLFKIIKGHFVESGYISHLVKYKQLFWEQHGSIPDWIHHIQNFLIINIWLGDLLAIFTLFIEFFFFASLFSRQSRLFVLALALSLHASITIFTKVYFFEHILMLILLLLMSLCLLLREQTGFGSKIMRQWLPKIPLTNFTPISGKSHAVRMTALYAVSLVALLGVMTLPLPAFSESSWLMLEKLHGQYHLFPTDSYLFIFINDVLISILALIVCSGIIFLMAGNYLKALTRTTFSDPKTVALPQVRFLIYDGDCGFCQRWVDWSERRGAFQTVTFTQFQSMPDWVKNAVGLPDVAYTKYAVYADFTVLNSPDIRTGAAAINQVLTLLPGPGNFIFRFTGCLYQLDLIRQIQNLGYKIIAHNRYLIAPGECKI